MANNIISMYDDSIVKIMNDTSKFEDNVLQDYDNVIYHCSLFAYDKNTQLEIDEQIKSGSFNYNSYKNSRIYVCKSDESAVFTIDSFTIQSLYGIGSASNNVSAYSIEITIKEYGSCILTNALQILGSGYNDGYNGYIYRPYWFEIWFSGYKKIEDGGESVPRIPLNKTSNKGIQDSILYYGSIVSCKSHIDDNGTTWKIKFVPVSQAMLSKYINHLYVSSSLKHNTELTFNEFVNACIDNMFERFLNNCAKGPEFNKDDEEKEIQERKDEIKKKYKDNKFIEINYAKGNIANIKSSMGTNTETDKKADYNIKTDTTTKFTDLCQDFIFNAEGEEDVKSIILRFDIKASILDYWNGIPLLSFKVDIYAEKDDILSELYKTRNISTSTKEKFLEKLISEKSLIKKYQYSFSGEDTSVVSIDNSYDLLYYMNAMEPLSARYKENRLQNNKENEKNISEKTEENNNNKNNIKTGDKNAVSFNFNGGLLEDLYYNLLKTNKSDGFNPLLNKVRFYNDLAPVPNEEGNNSVDYSKDNSALTIKQMWNDLYRSGQMSMTKIEIIGDPYWLVSNSLSTSISGSTKVNNALIYRLIFNLRTSPYLNYNDITNDITIDYSNDLALNVSGIYVVTKVISDFSNGHFKQKVEGFLDNIFLNDYNIKKEIQKE